ncbi:MAG: magnesium/cobalt efflux protein, partial [Roseovarius sp.]|nr:magnesium/cobalt efflux protein [Roseovarius sp.]
MGESIDGSSMAAQSAPPDDDRETEESGGFFRRILGVFSTSDETEEAKDE